MTIPYVDGKKPEISEREQVLLWISQERMQYSDIKYAEESANRIMLRNAIQEGDFGKFIDFAFNYIKRVDIYGIAELEKAKQALGKGIVTLMHMLEMVIEYHGDLPKPGVTSGEIHIWE